MADNEKTSFAPKLRALLIFAFVAQVVVIFAVVGIYADYQLRRVIEEELAARMRSFSALAAAAAEKLPVEALLASEPGSRLHRSLDRRLQEITAAAELSRIVFTDLRGRVVYDSRGELPMGREYIRTRFDAQEFQAAKSGTIAVAPFFNDALGRPFKAAYAPVRSQGRVAGVLCVEASAAGLQAIPRTRRIILTLALVVLALAVALAAALAVNITRPLERLNTAAEAIGRGDYDRPVRVGGTRDVIFLGRTLESMRQAILQREKRLQMMLVGIAHEIRNPLGGMELFTDLLKKQCGDAQQQAVDRIAGEIQHLKRIVERFLQYARPEPLHREPCNLRRLVLEARDLLGEGAKSVAWEMEVPDSLVLELDSGQMRGVFLNLFHNAAQAMSESETARIRIRAEETGEGVKIFVEDSGPGIPPEQAEQIFEPFYSNRHQGTGLGLALVKQTVEAHGGAVQVLPGNPGATFLIFLPRKAEGN